MYKKNNAMILPKAANDITKEFTDVFALKDHGVILPHNPHAPPDDRWKKCDPRDTDFTVERDAACQGYLTTLNNMRSIKTMSSILLSGRTIKFKVYYHHGNITAIIKVSQKKFFYEPVSEYLAFALDRVLNGSRVPTTAYVPLPVDYMRAPCAVVSPFMTQWFEHFVPDYSMAKQNLFKVWNHKEINDHRLYANVSVQLWMLDVHSALYTKLALNYKYNKKFIKRYFIPGNHAWPPAPLKHRALSDLMDRFAFDFILGNTDRGMNDHNNFVYGGCDRTTDCKQPPPHERTKQEAKYAFIDHGSSFYSRHEPEDSPFTGNDTLPCRFRKVTYDNYKKWQSGQKGSISRHPVVHEVKKGLPKGLFNVVHYSTFATVQTRLDKVITVVEDCIAQYGKDEVFSLI